MAPSWSWASIKCGLPIYAACGGSPWGAQKWYFDPRVVLVPVSEVTQVEIVNSGVDEFGEVKSGTLHLKGPCKNLSSFEKTKIRLPLAEDAKLREDGICPCVYEVQSECVTCWLDSRPVEEENEEDLIIVRIGLCELGATIVHIASLDSSSFRERFGRDTSDYERPLLSNQHWALILEPVSGQNDEGKRIGIARVADRLVDGWETGLFAII